MILITHENGWTMHMQKEYADDPEEVAKVREVLRMIGEIERGERNEKDTRKVRR